MIIALKIEVYAKWLQYTNVGQVIALIVPKIIHYTIVPKIQFIANRKLTAIQPKAQRYRTKHVGSLT